MSKTKRRLIAKHHPEAFARLVTHVKKSKHIQEISAADLKKLLDAAEPILVIDVREESERSQFYIAGSRHISKGVLERDIEAVITPQNQDVRIITVCSGGYRSALAAASLLDMGYKDVYSLAGGLKAYLEQDFDNIIELEDKYFDTLC